MHLAEMIESSAVGTRYVLFSAMIYVESANPLSSGRRFESQI
jgi:hypothetical protein